MYKVYLCGGQYFESDEDAKVTQEKGGGKIDEILIWQKGERTEKNVLVEKILNRLKPQLTTEELEVLYPRNITNIPPQQLFLGSVGNTPQTVYVK